MQKSFQLSFDCVEFKENLFKRCPYSGVSLIIMKKVIKLIPVQSNLSNMDTKGTEQSVHMRDLSI